MTTPNDIEHKLNQIEFLVDRLEELDIFLAQDPWKISVKDSTDCAVEQRTLNERLDFLMEQVYMAPKKIKVPKSNTPGVVKPNISRKDYWSNRQDKRALNRSMNHRGNR